MNTGAAAKNLNIYRNAYYLDRSGKYATLDVVWRLLLRA